MDYQQAVSFLTDTHDFLATQHDLSPRNPAVTNCLTRLVANLETLPTAPFASQLCHDPALASVKAHLPDMCGVAECAMEKYWCRKIINDTRPGFAAVADFWYLDHYRSLTRAEMDLIGRENIKRVAFLGAGALPLMACLLAHDNPDVTVRCIDHDAEACELADALIHKLGFGNRITIMQQKAEAFTPCANETVICASLLKADGLYTHLLQHDVNNLVVRDAEGAFEFLYHPAHLPAVGYREIAKTKPSPGHINTSRSYQKIPVANQNTLLADNILINHIY